jgi:acetate kinase
MVNVSNPHMLFGGHTHKSAFCRLTLYDKRCNKNYTAAMNGLDVLVYTAGVGKNSVLLRHEARMIARETYRLVNKKI